MNALKTSKKVMRQRIGQKLADMSSEALERQSHEAAKSLLNMREYHNARRISIYLSIEGKEVQTAGIVEDALGSGKQVFVPYVHTMTTVDGKSKSVMDMLALESKADFQSFHRDSWGIPSVPPETVRERKNSFGGYGVSRKDRTDEGDPSGLDLIVVPGVAFDRGLRRLGHGKGYYDVFLSKCKELVDSGQMERMPFLVALALDDQILHPSEEIPVSSHDWHVDRLVRGSEIL